jgi:DNA-binding HxlR family transcriptional regulator
VEYALTEKGRALLPIVEGMRSYGEEWLGEGGSEVGLEPIARAALAVA